MKSVRENLALSAAFALALACAPEGDEEPRRDAEAEQSEVMADAASDFDGSMDVADGSVDAATMNEVPDASPDAGYEADAGAAPMEEGPIRADELHIPKNHRVSVHVLENDDVSSGSPVTLEIAKGPSSGVARVRGNTLEYEPVNQWTGIDQMRYRVVQNLRTVGQATLTVHVDDEVWQLLGDTYYELSTIDLLSPLSGAPGEHVTVPRDISAEGILVGSSGEGSALRPFHGAKGALVSEPLAAGERGALHHWSAGGEAAGWSEAANLSSRSALTLSGAGSLASSVLPLAVAVHAFDGQGRVVGELTDADVLGDALRHAVRFAVEKPDEPEVLDPDACTEGALAASANASGEVVGNCFSEEGTRAFLLSDAGVTLLSPEGSRFAQAEDVADDGEVVGFFESAEGSVLGYSWQEGSFLPIQVRDSLETRVHGLGPSGALVGSWLSPLGYTRGFLLEPFDLVDRLGSATLVPSQEAFNYHIDHACGHTLRGPFQTRVAATDGEAPPLLAETHVTFQTGLPMRDDGRHGGRVTLVSGAPGRASLYVYPSVPMRLVTPEGTTLPVRHATRTSTCAGIHWVHELTVDGDDYLVELGPTSYERVDIIYERGWAYP